MYLYVLLGTRRYTKVQGDTCWYNEQYKTVCTGMYWYVLVCTGMYSTVQPGYAALRLNLLL
jgi:septal ring-binding cell division protein DamX